MHALSGSILGFMEATLSIVAGILQRDGTSDGYDKIEDTSWRLAYG
jgi:hypothetical protein